MLLRQEDSLQVQSRSPLRIGNTTMRIFLPLLSLVLVARAQFGGFMDFFRGVNRGVQHMFVDPVMHAFQGSRPSFRQPHFHQPQFQPRPHFGQEPFFGGPQEERRPKQNDEGGIDFSKSGGTVEPQATGRDKLFPDDCGRDPEKKTGLLCFPDGILCQERVNRVGNHRYGNHLYWLSWQSDDPQLRNAKWDWFNARNYCRKRCMDLVSFETRDEYEFIKQQMGGVKYFWTSGRLCDFDGCDRPDFFPKNINGWFWSANQARLSPTNSTSAFHDWSQTGGFQPPRPQPDNREKIQQNGDSESCMAVLNNFYGDGIKWHDVACHHEKPVVCEDVEGHLGFARQNFPNLRIP